MNANNGFTLVELMITVAVLAIVLSIAVPSFSSLIINNRVTTQANALIASINLARSEAIKRGIQVAVAVSNNSNNWENGWSITVGGNDGVVMRRQASFEGNSTLRAQRGDSSINQVAFSSRGFLVGNNVIFKLCNLGVAANRQKKLTISSSGRVVVSDDDCS